MSHHHKRKAGRTELGALAGLVVLASAGAVPGPLAAQDPFACAVDQIRVDFFVTEMIETWQVPEGVESIRIIAAGARGGDGDGDAGGAAAQVAGTFPVAPLSTLHVIVGEQGEDSGCCGGGGGGSFVGVGGFAYDAADPESTQLLLVAGGGGGGLIGTGGAGGLLDVEGGAGGAGGGGAGGSGGGAAPEGIGGAGAGGNGGDGGSATLGDHGAGSSGIGGGGGGAGGNGGDSVGGGGGGTAAAGGGAGGDGFGGGAGGFGGGGGAGGGSGAGGGGGGGFAGGGAGGGTGESRAGGGGSSFVAASVEDEDSAPYTGDDGFATICHSGTAAFSPVRLAADPESLPALSDGNEVFEPGERVEVVPAWRNDGDLPQVLTGTASDFTGPDGPAYTLVFDAAAYGEVEPDTVASCLDGETCYQMEIGPLGVPRPVLHWDATFEEILSDETVKTWTLHVGDSFTDVQRASLFYRSIETLLHHGISGEPSLARLHLPLLGCSETEFCPAVAHTRADAAVFLLKGLEGAAFDPPDCVSGDELFDDVPAEDPFCPWIEELARRGVTAGCGSGNYCPDAAVTRAQIAVLLLKTLEGPDYVPPECTGVFADVACPSPFANWIEELFARGFTAGCGGGNYCPNQPITRAQMAAFVTRAFGLVLYGP